MNMLATLSLRSRLILVVLLPTLMLATGLAGYFIVHGTQAADRALRERGVSMISFLAPSAEFGVVSGNAHTLNGLVQAVLEQPDVAAAAIYDRSGEQLSISGRPVLVDPARIMATAEPTVLAERANRLAIAAPVLSVPLFIDDVLAPFRHVTPPVEPIGWVYLELDTQALNAHKRTVLTTTLGMSLTAFLLTMFLAARMARSVSRPVARLATAVGRIAAGDLRVSVPGDATSGELRALEHGFNTMARAIAEARNTLQARVDQATAQLAYQATHDPLTELPNRRAFEQALEDAVSASRRVGDSGVLCFIDLDRFKVVNDTSGHAAGDVLLKNIAQLICSRLRADDLICRIGGDEFALILKRCSLDEARRIAEGLRSAIAEYQFEWGAHTFTIGASIGLCPIDGRENSQSDIVVAADLACYAAKKSGRNQVVIHEHPPE